MRIYVASSWRNEARQQATVLALRGAGHTVYDFRNPSPGDTGFGWRQCATPEQLKDPARFRDEVLPHQVACDGFRKDMTALREAALTVLVLPSGRSAHLELGYAVGARQHTVVLLDDPMSEPELMYKMCSAICTTIDEVLERADQYDAIDDRIKAALSRAAQERAPADVAQGAEGQPQRWGVFDTWERKWCPRFGTEEEMGQHAVKLSTGQVTKPGEVMIYRFQPLPLPPRETKP